MDAYAIPLDSFDIILGITFLHTLGPILWDLEDLCMAGRTTDSTGQIA
jgi:hypothetical protein